MRLDQVVVRDDKSKQDLQRSIEFQLYPDLIEDLAGSIEVRTYSQDGVLFYEGDRLSYIVLSIYGEVRLAVSNGRNLDKVEVGQILPGELFGVWETLENYNSPATVTCKKGSKVLLIRSADFLDVISKSPVKANLFKALAGLRGLRGFVTWLLSKKVRREQIEEILQSELPPSRAFKKNEELKISSPHLLLIDSGKIFVQQEGTEKTGFLEKGDFFGASLFSKGSVIYSTQIISDAQLSMIPLKKLQDILDHAIFEEIGKEPKIKQISFDGEAISNRNINGAQVASGDILKKLGFDFSVKVQKPDDAINEIAMNPIINIFRIFKIESSESLLLNGLENSEKYSFADYAELIESFGLITRHVRIDKSTDEIKSFPFLAFFQGRPILILSSFRSDFVFIDPFAGVMRIDRDFFGSRWGGSGLEIHRSPVHEFTVDAKSESLNPQILGRKFVQALDAKTRLLLNQSVAMSCFQTYIVAAIPTFFVSILTDLLGSRSNHLLVTYFIGLIILLIYQVIAQYLTSENNTGLYEELRVGSRPYFYKLSLEAPQNLAQPMRPGTVISKFLSIDFMLNANKQKKVGWPVAITSFLVYFILLTSFSWQGASIILFLSIAAIAVAYFIRNHVGLDELSTSKQRQEQFDSWAEFLGGMDTVKSTNMEKIFRQKVEESNFGLADSGRVYQNSMSFISSLSRVFTDLAPIAAVFICSYSVLNKVMPMEDLIGISVYASFCLRPITQIVNLILYSTTGPGLQQSVGQMMKQEESKRVEKVEARQKISCTGRIRLERVSFRYREGQPAVSDISVTIQAGQVVAVVGRSGAGKSTLARLLAGLIKPQGGKIFFNEVDSRIIHEESLRRQIGFVSQTPKLFGGSIADNISYGDDNPNREKIIQCAKAAGAHEFIMTLANGYDYCLSEEGYGLSVGEKQLITLARVLYNDPKMLVLDEATVHLDPKAETIVSNRLLVHLNYKTVVVVVQRISTARKADIILVVKGGRIIEQGSHNQLMSMNGEYAELYRNQVGVDS
jgi:ATP-binding cassette subfamily B protein